MNKYVYFFAFIYFLFTPLESYAFYCHGAGNSDPSKCLNSVSTCWGYVKSGKATASECEACSAQCDEIKHQQEKIEREKREWENKQRERNSRQTVLRECAREDEKNSRLKGGSPADRVRKKKSKI